MTFSILSFLTLATAILTLGSAELVAAWFLAPEGFEDREGFHFRFVSAA